MRPRMFQIESPVTSTPLGSCSSATWPGECPGVCRTRSPPATSRTWPSTSCSSTGVGALPRLRRISRPPRVDRSRTGPLPSRTYAASRSCTATVAPVRPRMALSPPTWSGWAWVTSSRVTSGRRDAHVLEPGEDAPRGAPRAGVDERDLPVVVDEREGAHQVAAHRRDAPDARGELQSRAAGHCRNLSDRGGRPSRGRARHLGSSHAVLRVDHRPGRQHPSGQAVVGRPGRPGHRPREGRVLQPRRLGQGPHRGAHDRRGREVRRAAARRHDRRADVGQHGHRAGAGGPAPRLPVRLRAAGQGLPGQDQRPHGVRRAGRGVPDGRRARGPAVLLLGQRPAGARDRRGLEARPVQQPRQPPVALRDHRARALGPDRRPHHPLRRRRRHRRHDQRHRALPQGGQRRPGAGHRRRPRGLGLLRRHRPALPRRGCR